MTLKWRMIQDEIPAYGMLCMFCDPSRSPNKQSFIEGHRTHTDQHGEHYRNQETGRELEGNINKIAWMPAGAFWESILTPVKQQIKGE